MYKNNNCAPNYVKNINNKQQKPALCAGFNRTPNFKEFNTFELHTLTLYLMLMLHAVKVTC